MAYRKVKINSDPAEVIATLYDVSDEAAAEIVARRQRFGPFRGPLDLAEVRGVSLWLARTLEPHIDWASEEEDQPKARSWLDIIVGAGVLLFVGALATEIPRGFLPVRTWLGGAKLACMLVMAALLVAFGVTSLAEGWATSTRRYQRARRRELAIGALMVLFFVPVGLLMSFAMSTAVQALSLRMSVALGVWFYLPGLLARFWPGLARNRVAARIFEAGVVVVIVTLAIATWLGAQGIGPLLRLVLGAFGVFGLLFFGLALRNGALYAAVVANPLFQRAESGTRPRPGDGYNLEPSPLWRKTVLGLAFAAFGWLVVQAVTGALQWAIGGWLDKVTHWFG